jgi:hypothetical protein
MLEATGELSVLAIVLLFQDLIPLEKVSLLETAPETTNASVLKQRNRPSRFSP